MGKKIALLRGVNVGGNNKLPMKSFSNLLENLGCTKVATYIQSGNAVFEGALSAEALSQSIEDKHGFCPITFVLTLAALKKAHRNCPFATAGERDGKTVHVAFLDSSPPKNISEEFDAIKNENEHYAFSGKVLYLETPDGLSKSAIAAKMNRFLKMPYTVRNWNTVNALIALAERDD